MSSGEDANGPQELESVQSTCDAFDLGQVTEIKDMGGTRNRNFACRTERGHWLLRRRHEAYSSPEQLAFDHSVAAFLSDGRVPVPAPLTTTGGATWWMQGDNLWEGYRFVQGAALRSGEPAETAALGTALGHWHQAGRSFSGRYMKGGIRGETTPDLLLNRAERIEQESPPAQLIVEIYRRQVKDAAGRLTDECWAALPHTVIHGDVQPANLLLRGDELVAFVDLDWCSWQARIYDLCFAILVCCANHDEEFDGSNIWSLTQTPFYRGDATETFLKAYQEIAGPLTAEEKRALTPQLILTLCHARLAGALKVSPARRAAFLERPPNPSDTSWLPDL